MVTNWNTSEMYGGVFGIAKDGHVIYGPYNAQGQLWDGTELDACNGFRLSDGSYGYATTTKFPYAVGCFGPAPVNTVGLLSSCTTNAFIKGGMIQKQARFVSVGLAAFVYCVLIY